MAKTKMKIGIIENNYIFREHLSAIINSQKDMAVVLSSITPDALSGAIAADLVLLPWEIAGAPVFSQQNKSENRAKLLVYNADTQQRGFVCRIRRGAIGFVLINSSKENIVKAIRSAMEGNWIIPPPVTARICSEIIQEEKERSESEIYDNVMITNRERQILRLTLEDMTNKEIAQRLNIAVSTVKTHVHDILKKLGFQKRRDLAHYLRNVKVPTERIWP